MFTIGGKGEAIPKPEYVEGAIRVDRPARESHSRHVRVDRRRATQQRQQQQQSSSRRSSSGRERREFVGDGDLLEEASSPRPCRRGGRPRSETTLGRVSSIGDRDDRN